jgi:hypothetical protein
MIEVKWTIRWKAQRKLSEIQDKIECKDQEN